MLKNDKQELKIFILGVFIFLAAIMYLSPWSSDDYRLLAYDFQNIKEAFFFHLHYANGRILGNFLGYVIANSLLLKVLVKAFVITAVIFMIPAVLNIKKSWAYFMSFVLLLTLDPEIFGQVYSWTAGFNNYVPPIFLMCLTILLIEKYADKQGNIVGAIVLIIAISALSVLSQLYLELNTLVNIVLAAALVIINKKNDKRRQMWLYLECLLFLVIGAAIMVILPKIFNANSPTYRGLQIENISTFVRSTVSNGIKLFTYFENNTLLCCCLLAICVFLVVGKKELFPKPIFSA